VEKTIEPANPITAIILTKTLLLYSNLSNNAETNASTIEIDDESPPDYGERDNPKKNLQIRILREPSFAVSRCLDLNGLTVRLSTSPFLHTDYRPGLME